MQMRTSESSMLAATDSPASPCVHLVGARARARARARVRARARLELLALHLCRMPFASR